MTNGNPLLDYLGIRLTSWEQGRAQFELELEPKHLNRRSSLQGGVIATLLDAACGYSGRRADEGQQPRNAVTVMLTVSYLEKVHAGRLTATGRVSLRLAGACTSLPVSLRRRTGL